MWCVASFNFQQKRSKNSVSHPKNADVKQGATLLLHTLRLRRWYGVHTIVPRAGSARAVECALYKTGYSR